VKPDPGLRTKHGRPSSGVTPVHLNKHIDYSSCCAPIPNAENSKSLAFPMDMAETRGGAREQG
jgi:hypothetical protein